MSSNHGNNDKNNNENDDNGNPHRQQSIKLKAQCLCKSHTFVSSPILTSSSSSLPLKAMTCHCDSCRHVTGALSGSRAMAWPANNNDDESERSSSSSIPHSLREYQFSADMTLMFCGKCSSPMFVRDSSSSTTTSSSSSPPQQQQAGHVKWWVCTGVLDKTIPGLKQEMVDWGTQMFVGDTIDGGASNWIKGHGSSSGSSRRWLGRAGKSQAIEEGEYWPTAVGCVKKESGDVKNEILPSGGGVVKLKCRCGGVDLVIKAGQAQREYEEMEMDKEKEKNGKQLLPWFIDRTTHKSVGTLCGCDSCRIWSGVELFSWTFVSLKHVGFGTGGREEEKEFPQSTIELRAAVDEEAKDEKRFGTLAYYESSPDVQRYFCSRCAACVFYCLDNRPEMVDVAVGLLHSPDGARAESMIFWEFGGPYGWREDMVGTWREGLLNMVESESEEWRVKRGYPESWRRAAKKAQAAEKSSE